MSVRWSGRGRARLLEQVAKIAAEDPAAATRWLAKVEDGATASSIASTASTRSS
jgi:hypothetical protein